MLDRTSFLRDLNFGRTKDEHTKRYRTELRDALQATGTFTRAVAASVFTTQSVTADLEKIRRQIGASTTPSFMPLAALDVFPGSVGRLVFGTFESPDYETAAHVIPPTGTRTGTPQPQA